VGPDWLVPWPVGTRQAPRRI